MTRGDQIPLDLHDTQVYIQDLILRILHSQKLTAKLLQDLDTAVMDFTDEKKALGKLPEGL